MSEYISSTIDLWAKVSAKYSKHALSPSLRKLALTPMDRLKLGLKLVKSRSDIDWAQKKADVIDGLRNGFTQTDVCVIYHVSSRDVVKWREEAGL